METNTSEKDIWTRMIEYREGLGLTQKEMAERLDLPEYQLRIVEEGSVTHPNIAAKIGRLYGFTELETEQLMPVNRRIHGGNYDPTKYVPYQYELKRKD